MAAPPSSIFSRYGGSNKRRIDGCIIDTYDGGVQQSPDYTPELLQPVSLHLSYDKNGVSSLRLRVSVILRDNPGITAILLDIPTDQVVSLSLHQRPDLPRRLISRIQPSQARLQLVLANPAGILIAPSATKALNPETPPGAQFLSAMRMLSQSLRVVIYLPVGDDLWEHVSAAHVSALPNAAVSSESLLRVADSPAQLDLKTLYGGKGGRIVPPSETFGQPVIEGDTEDDSGAVDDAGSPPGADLPPSYNDTVPPGAANPSRKRLRPSLGDDAPQSRKGEGSDNKAGRLNNLREAWDQVGAMIEQLHASTAAAVAMDARLRATIQELKEAQCRGTEAQRPKSPPPRAASDTLSPTPSGAETGSHTSSVSETISEKLKVYLDERLAQFSRDMRAHHNSRLERRLDESLAEYPTIEHMEQYVGMEFGELAVDFVDEHEMWDAIQEAVDKVEEKVRTRMLDAWSR